MNLSETGKLLALVREYYPAFMAGKSQDEAMRTAKLWQEMFADDDAQSVFAAIKAFVATDVKGFAPSIGQIKAKLVQQGGDGDMTEAEAWSLVKNALRNGLYGYHKEFVALPETIQRAVGSEDMLRTWAGMDESEVNTVVASNFMRSFRARAGYVREVQAMPKDVRALYEAVSEVFALPEASKKPKLEAPEGEPTEMPAWFENKRKQLQAAVQQERAERAKKLVARMMQNLKDE